MFTRNVSTYIIVENDKVTRIILNFNDGSVIVENQLGKCIFTRTGLDYFHMLKVRDSIENAIKKDKVII